MVWNTHGMMVLRGQEFELTSSFPDFLHLGACTDCPRNQRTPNYSIRECLLCHRNNLCKLYAIINCVNYIFVSDWAIVSLQLVVCDIVIKTDFVPLVFYWPCKMATAINVKFLCDKLNVFCSYKVCLTNFELTKMHIVHPLQMIECMKIISRHHHLKINLLIKWTH